MITGGWEFVWAAYGLTWASLALYTLSLLQRRRHAERDQQAERQLDRKGNS